MGYQRSLDGRYLFPPPDLLFAVQRRVHGISSSRRPLDEGRQSVLQPNLASWRKWSGISPVNARSKQCTAAGEVHRREIGDDNQGGPSRFGRREQL